MRDDKQSSSDSLSTKRNWYELNPTRTKCDTIETTKQQDEEGLVENAASIKVEKTFTSQLERLQEDGTRNKSFIR